MISPKISRTSIACLALCAACGTTAASTAETTEQASEADGRDRVATSDEQAGASNDSSGSTDDESDDEPCVGLPIRPCSEDPQCVFERGCRIAANECERVRPIPLSPSPMPAAGYFNPDFAGDPCARVNPACAFDLRREICTPFVGQAECPATRAEARTTSVFCMHPNQQSLDCQFAGGWCACHPPGPYCGGAAPSPDILNQPTTWRCLNDTTPPGCPTRAIQPGTRCRLAEGTQCSQGCGLLRCVGRRWQSVRLPPRA